MTHDIDRDFADDCIELATEQYRAGKLSRRQFMMALAALGVAPAMLGSRAASAAGKTLVMGTYGGDSQKALEKVFAPVYAKATGNTLETDGVEPSNGKIRAMVEAKQVIWDVCDGGVGAIGELGPLGLLEPIDYSIVDKKKVPPEFAYEYGVCNYMSSFVLAWDGKQVKSEPSLADFFDVKKIPGKRAIRKKSTGVLEMALMADGVAPDKLYPLDQERAFKKISSIKEHILFFGTGSQGMQLLRDSEVAMCYIWNTRANVLKKETDGRIDYTFKGGFLMPALWIVPKGNPAGREEAMRAIAAFQDPAAQVELLKMLSNGPANPEARALETPELLAIDNGAPKNAAVQAKTSADWYRDSYAASEKAYGDLIATFS